MPLGAGKALLVNYAGAMLTPNTFIPDNSLATLAQVLRLDGTDAQIIDYQNASDIGSVLQIEDRSVAEAIWASVSTGNAIGEELFETYRRQRKGAASAFE